jgi:hypothetical protein
LEITMTTKANRSFLVAIVALAAMLPAGLSLNAAERLQSGLQPGEPISTIFEPLNVTGPFAGEPHCMVCEHGANPVAMIFAREASAPLLRLLTKLDAATARHAQQEMGSFVVFLSDDANLPERLKAAAERHALKRVTLTTFEPAGPEGFKVTPEADVTVVLYTDHQVKANHAFRKGELNEEAIAKILADLAKIVGKP